MKKITFLLTFLLSINSTFSQYNFEQLISYSGSIGGTPNYFTIFNNMLYYSSASNPSSSNSELWKSNGNQNGTYQFADINLGFSGSSPRDFMEYNSYLYFTAEVFGVTGRELYRTNGTTTELFKDFRTGTKSGFDIGPNSHQFVIIDNIMYFFAREDDNGYDLWKTDGTVLGTQKLVELNSFNLGLRNYFFELNGDLIFLMDDYNDAIIDNELYKYSVATNTVSLIKDIHPSNSNTSEIHTRFITKFDNKLFFRADNGAEAKLYVTDGTEAGTYFVNNEIPINYTNPGQLHVFNNELYFIATVSGLGIDLYKCKKDILDIDQDGNYEDYVLELVHDFNVGGNNNLQPFVDYLLTEVPPVFLEHNNELYFAAREQNAPNNGNNYQIYKTNGTTTQIAFTIDETQMGAANDPLYLLKSFDNKLFFTIKGVGMPTNQLWVTNTANGSVTRLTDYYGLNSQPQDVSWSVKNRPIAYNNELFFRASTNNEGAELWKISSGSLSTEPIEKDNKISIYPNPTSNVINIQINKTNNFSIKIYDVVGKQISIYKNQKTIDLSDFRSGIYLVKIIDLENNQTTVKKINKL